MTVYLLARRAFSFRRRGAADAGGGSSNEIREPHRVVYCGQEGLAADRCALYLFSTAVRTSSLFLEAAANGWLLCFAMCAGISNFLVPLRLKSIPENELAPVVIVAPKRFIAQEMDAIRCFARVWVLGGSPLKRPHLDSVSLSRCSSVAVVSAHTSAALDGGGDLFMIDRDVVFCTLLVKSVAKSHLKLAGNLSSVQSTSAALSCGGGQVARGRKYGGISESINLFTELLYSKNAVFLVEEVNRMGSLQLFEGFARGRLFCVSTFDSLLCHAVYSPDTCTTTRRAQTSLLYVEADTSFT